MFDLLRTLNPSSEQAPLTIGEDDGFVYVKGLTYEIANNEEEALNLLFEGETNRTIGQHVLNKQSSRSHCIFSVRIECRSLLASDEKYRVSKLNLVDLAGSERLAKTNVGFVLLFFFSEDPIETKFLLLLFSFQVGRRDQTRSDLHQQIVIVSRTSRR